MKEADASGGRTIMSLLVTSFLSMHLVLRLEGSC